MTRRARYLAALLAAAAAIPIGAGAAGAQPAAPAAAGARVTLAPAAAMGGVRLNPTSRAVTLAVTARLDNAALGEIMIGIDVEDRVSFDAGRLLDLLAPVVDTATLRNLRAAASARPALTGEDLAAAGIALRYDPQVLELVVEVASERRLSQSIRLSNLDENRVGSFVAPAEVSAYLNLRGNFDYLWGDGGGFGSPILFADAAARIGGVVFESEAILQPGGGPLVNRLGSRLVYDDQERLIRWTAGDLQTLARGFQSAPDIAGISLFRSYSVLQPQRVARPRGGRRFRLDRASTVEIEANGQVIRRLQLQPGNYDLRDFPFAQGANDIRLNILDDAGRSEVLRFNLFLDQTQLGKGLKEFGLFAGVLAPPGASGPEYTDDAAATGYFRFGASDALTLGVNAQADSRTQMAGAEATWSTSLGTLSGNFSISHTDGLGAGLGSQVTFQRLIQRAGGRADSLTLFAEARSRTFSALGEALPFNPFLVEVGGAYSHAFSNSIYGGVDARYAKGRGDQRDAFNLRTTIGIRLARRLSFTGDVNWQQDERGRSLGGLLSLTMQLGRSSNLRADYDTRFERARLSYTSLNGQGVGSYNIAADLERSPFGTGANVTASYYHNRAEIGFSHFGSFQNDFGGSVNQRTSLRFGTSLAMADGTFSLGRPIHDSFAIVSAHRSLRGTQVVVEPNPLGFAASTGALGVGHQPSLSSYVERVIDVDAPAAPAGVDLGQGTFRVLPPYRSGYRLTVGSDYNLTAIGRLLDVNGDPVVLLTGAATELARPEREALAIFTNRDGRFGVTGLAAGQWRIEMNDDRRSTYLLDIPKAAQNIHRAGELRPLEGQQR